MFSFNSCFSDTQCNDHKIRTSYGGTSKRDTFINSIRRKKQTDNNLGLLEDIKQFNAGGKDGQTISGSTTIRSDDISNTLTVNVVLKNKNDKNGHLDTSADVIVWVVPAALSL
jgi:hypothetical protein